MIPVLWVPALAGSLGIQDLTPCTGGELPAGAEVTVHYEGRLEDGTVFDSSRQRGTPITVPIGKGRVIEGWEIGMQGMSIGCTRRLTIPPELAYGDREIGPIPPGSTLTFEIELLGMGVGRPPPPAKPHEPGTLQRTASGLAFRDLRPGRGPRPEPGQTAVVEYTLWLADGTLVDSSYNRSEPFRYQVGRGMVIDGWEEAVLDMQVGAIRHFRVPWSLGYGKRGRPPVIPRKTDLIFEVELLEVR